MSHCTSDVNCLSKPSFWFTADFLQFPVNPHVDSPVSRKMMHVGVTRFHHSEYVCLMLICSGQQSSLAESLSNYEGSASCHLVVLICSTSYTQSSGPTEGCLWSVCPHRVAIIASLTLLFRIWISVHARGKSLSSMMCLSWSFVSE